MQQAPDFVIFLGRFHPLVVHLPIGLLLIAFIMEVYSRWKKKEAIRESVSFVLFIGAISAVLAVIMGLMLAEGGGYNEDTLGLHKWMGIGVAVLSILAWAIKTRPQLKSAAMQKAYMPLMVVATLLLVGTGHYGGNLTHGSEYLFQYAPQPIRAIAGLPPKSESEPKPITNINEANVFNDIIHPVLKGRCESCHNADKMKGGLRMDTQEKLLEGGENGVIFVAGNPDESEMYQRLLLPEEDEEHMPPEGKRPLTDEQIRLIEWWIAAGSPFDKTVAEVEVPEDIHPILAKLGPGGEITDRPEGIFAKAVPPADAGAMERLQDEGVLVMPIAQDINFLQVQVNRDTTPFGNEEMNLLKPLAEQITWLDLRHATPSDFSVLAELTNLSRIHLENTGVTDDDLAHLSNLENLEYLNLYGTNISNEGLKHLENLPNLKSLYLWQTKVDKDAAEALKAKNPELEVNLGWEQQASR